MKNLSKVHVNNVHTSTVKLNNYPVIRLHERNIVVVVFRLYLCLQQFIVEEKLSFVIYLLYRVNNIELLRDYATLCNLATMPNLIAAALLK